VTARTAAIYQGRYAGAVSRFAAYAIDLAVSSGAFWVALEGISFGVQVVTGHGVSWNRSSGVVAGIFVVWQFLYFGYSWAASGRASSASSWDVRTAPCTTSSPGPPSSTPGACARRRLPLPGAARWRRRDG